MMNGAAIDLQAERTAILEGLAANEGLSAELSEEREEIAYQRFDLR